MFLAEKHFCFDQITTYPKKLAATIENGSRLVLASRNARLGHYIKL